MIPKGMKIQHLILSVFVLGLSSCTVVEGIFKAGMVWGILLVVIVVGLIVALILRAGKK